MKRVNACFSPVFFCLRGKGNLILITWFGTGPHSTISNKSDCRSRGHGPMLLWRLIIKYFLLSFYHLLNQEELVSVTSKIMCNK